MDKKKLYASVEQILDEFAGEELSLDQFSLRVNRNPRRSSQDIDTLASQVANGDSKAVRPLVLATLHTALDTLVEHQDYGAIIGIGGLIYQATEAILQTIVSLTPDTPANFEETLREMARFLLRDFIVEETVTYSDSDLDLDLLMQDMMHIVKGFPPHMARIFVDFYGMTDDEDDARIDPLTLDQLASQLQLSTPEILRLQQQGLNQIFTILSK